jgi:hypothetical protein
LLDHAAFSARNLKKKTAEKARYRFQSPCTDTYKIFKNCLSWSTKPKRKMSFVTKIYLLSTKKVGQKIVRIPYFLVIIMLIIQKSSQPCVLGCTLYTCRNITYISVQSTQLFASHLNLVFKKFKKSKYLVKKKFKKITMLYVH